jgi:hypothetical protein
VALLLTLRAIVVALAFASACLPSSAAVRALTPSPVASLRAFARLYGVIRWFHPSDAAAAIDWDRVAVEGVRRVIDPPDASALRTSLDQIFTPIAPTVHIAARGESFPDEAALHPAGAASLDVVAWEHNGYGDTAVPSGYASKRRHREQTVAVRGFPFASLWQAVDAAPYRGSLIRLRGKLRTASAARGQLWLRIERGDATGFSDDMSDRPVVNAAWTTAEVSGPVDTEATRIVFGIRQVTSKGTVWYDDLELAAQAADGTWKPIEVANPGFEAGDPLATWKPGIGIAGASSTTGWSVGLDHDRAASGNVCLRTEPATEVTSKELFDDAPQPGETVDIDLGSGLRARVPIALYSRNGQTIGDDPAAARRSQAGARPMPQRGYDVMAGSPMWSSRGTCCSISGPTGTRCPSTGRQSSILRCAMQFTTGAWTTTSQHCSAWPPLRRMPTPASDAQARCIRPCRRSRSTSSRAGSSSSRAPIPGSFRAT